MLLGGTGFLGSHLLEELIRRKWDTRILGRHPHTNRFVSTHVVASVAIDYATVGDWAAMLAGTDVLFHCLGTTVPASSNDDPVFDIQSNLVPTLSILDGAVKAGVKRVVFFSSGGTVYGNAQKLPIPETHPTNPLCSYGIGKLATEKYLELFRHLYDLDYLILRLSNPYGEGQTRNAKQGIISSCLHKIARNEPIHIWGDGSAIRDFIYVKDAIAGVMAALDTPGPHRLFNVGTGHGTSIRKILEMIQIVTGPYHRIEFAAPRGGDVPENVLDITRLCSTTAWRPSVSLSEGISLTWEHIKANLNKSPGNSRHASA